MRVRGVFAIYDNNISPGLLIIIIKIIILYFIQIRHTDDFPPTGTPASKYNMCSGYFLIRLPLYNTVTL